MNSSIRRLCHVLERPPDRVRADLKALETLFECASPGALRLSPARWRNIKSDVRRALKLTGADRPVPDINSPLKKASLTGFHATAKHIAAKAVSPSSETMRTI